MSKRDTIRSNLMRLSHTRSFRAALKEWRIEKILTKSRRNIRCACELCATPFGRGALIKHNHTGASVVVGGTCLQTLLTGHFGVAETDRVQRNVTRTRIRQAYDGLIDPGDWINWLIEHAPDELAPIVASLYFRHAVEQDADLESLIRFHDETRRYHRDALIGDQLELLMCPDVGDYLTINEFRSLQEPFANMWHFFESEVKPWFCKDSGVLRCFRLLPRDAQIRLLVLAKLSEGMSIYNVPFCDEACFNECLPVSPTDDPYVFLWHPNVGVGYVPRWHPSQDSGYVVVWHRKGKTSDAYAFNYWRTVLRMPGGKDTIMALRSVAFPTWADKKPELSQAISRKATRLDRADDALRSRGKNRKGSRND